MAIRVHLAAALSEEKEGFQREVSSPLELRLETSGPWIWARASVWDVAGEDLDRGLAKLPCPTLRATTVDGALWELRLQGPDNEPAAMTHHFALLAPEMADEFEDYEEVQELAEDGWIEEQQVAALAKLSPAEAMEKVQQDSQTHILEAVAALGLPGKSDELRAVLDGSSVTPEELEWDIGNLARFLAALGIEGPFDDWRQEIEDQRSQEADRLRAAAERPPEDLVLPLEQALEGVEPQPLKGGPAVVRLEHLIHLPWSCNKEITAGVRVTLPGGQQAPEVDAAAYPEVEIVQTPTSLRIGAHDFGRGATYLELCAEIQPLLEALPDGSVVELLCAEVAEEVMDQGPAGQLANLPPEVREQLKAAMQLEIEVNTAGNHLYSGVLRHGAWEVSAAHPAASRKDLEQACALFAAACQGEALPVTDEEAAGVQKATKKDIFMEDDPIIHQEGALSLESEPFRHLAALVFRQRFRHVWDVDQAEAAEQELWDSVSDDPLGEEPELGEILLHGSWSTFHHGTMEGWQRITAKEMATMDAQMKDLGLEPLGDLVAASVGNIVLRGYGASGATLYGTWMVGVFDTRVVDLFTTFEQGGSLTTTSNPVVLSDKDTGVFKQSFAAASPDKLYQQHQQKLEELTKQGRTPTEAEPDLIALARSIDQFMG